MPCANSPMDEHPVFWGYFPAYDWVAFNWLSGRMDELPFHYPQLCLDIKQWAIELGDPELPHQLGAGTTRCSTTDGREMRGRFSLASTPRWREAGHRSQGPRQVGRAAW